MWITKKLAAVSTRFENRKQAYDNAVEIIKEWAETKSDVSKVILKEKVTNGQGTYKFRVLSIWVDTYKYGRPYSKEYVYDFKMGYDNDVKVVGYRENSWEDLFKEIAEKEGKEYEPMPLEPIYEDDIYIKVHLTRLYSSWGWDNNVKAEKTIELYRRE